LSNNQGRKIILKKVLAFTVFTLFFASAVFAEDAALKNGWNLRGMITGSYVQTAVSDNWTGKETHNMTWQGKLFAQADLNLASALWTTRFREEYGHSQTDDAGTIVNLDYIELDSVYTWKLFKVFNPFVSFNIKTQNDKFLDPITYAESAGISTTIFNNSVHTLSTRLGVVAKQTFDDVTYKDGILVGDSRQTGAESVTNYTLNFFKDGKYITEFRVFETFEHGENLSWENSILMKMSSILVMQLSYRALFDNTRIRSHHWPDDIETLFSISLGVSFNMFGAAAPAAK
jgi:hypothetical protein